MEKVTKVTDLKQLVSMKKTGSVELEFPDGRVASLEIQGMSKGTFEAINEKYDDIKESRPQTFVRGQNANKWIDAPEDSQEYKDWQKKMRNVEALRTLDLVLNFMVLKPEGTFEEQCKFLNDNLLVGHFFKIIDAGIDISGLKTNKEEKIEQAKN